MAKTITPGQVKAWLSDDQEIAFADVRENGQYGDGHPFFVVSLPYSVFEKRLVETVPNPIVRLVLYDDDDGIAGLAAARAEDLGYSHRWHAVARGKLRDEFFWMRRELAEQILTVRGKRDINTAVDKWLDDRREPVDRFIATIDEMKLRSEIDFATLSVAASELHDLIST